MRTIITILTFLVVLLTLSGCLEEAAEVPKTKQVTVPEEKPVTKKPCPHGDPYPFDICGKKFFKPQKLESFPREIPDIAMDVRTTDLSKISDLPERLAGEWIGEPYSPEGADIIRIHWLFRPDQTFVASVFENRDWQSQSVQLFELISGTFSQQDGMLLLQLSEKQGPVTFTSLCEGYSWIFGSEGMMLKIPIALHENGKTLTLHANDEYLYVENVLVKKES